MALPNALNDRQRLSHIEDSQDGGVNRRVQVMNSSADAVPVDIVSGNITINGGSVSSGTIDGEEDGTKRFYVNNRKQQVLSAHDLVVNYSWLDFGSKNERVSSIVYTSATFTGDIITRTFNYTLVSDKYRLDSETWTAANGG